MCTKQKSAFADRKMLGRAIKDSFAKLSPKTQAKNPVMFLVFVSAILTSILWLVSLFGLKDAPSGYTLAIAIILWFTVLFANFAEAIAEGRGKAQADSLRASRKDVDAHKIPSVSQKDSVTVVPSALLKKGELVIVKAGEQIPADGEVIEGAASVDESAITGEWDKVHILVLKASATNSKLLLCQHNNASALGGFIGQRRKLSGVRQFLNINTIYRNELRCLSIAQGDCSGFVKHQNVYITGGFNGTTTHGQNICLVQSGHTGNTDGRKQSANGSRSKAYQQRYQSCYRGGILNSRQLCRKNGISVERDCHQDKDNGQGYQKNLQSNFVGRLLPGSTFYHRNHLVQKAFSGFVGHSDNNPVRQYSGAAGYSAAVAACLTNYRSGFTAVTRMSGVDFDGNEIRKGAADAMQSYVTHAGGMYSPDCDRVVKSIASKGGTPLVVAKNHKILGVIYLKDIIKQGVKEKFSDLRKMGIKTIMITGDNPITAAAIAAEAGVDDFLAEATPEGKLAMIRDFQAKGHLVAMTGDGTNDAPALAQADVAVAMNSGTQAAKEAGNMVDLDSSPTKLIDIVRIGKQLLMTRGSLTTFSIANDVAKYFAIIPALFMGLYPGLSALNIMGLHSPQSAVLSAIIYNALIIIALIPLALKGVKYREVAAGKLLSRNLLVYGLGGLAAPFIFVKLIDVLLVFTGLV